MGCVRCGRRRVDPVGGPSAWRRAVVGGEQVLVCPDCQVDGWTDGLDRCPTCGSTILVKQLGAVSCRGCGWVGEPSSGDGVPAETAAVPDDGLAAEVADAVGRVLGHRPVED